MLDTYIKLIIFGIVGWGKVIKISNREKYRFNTYINLIIFSFVGYDKVIKISNIKKYRFNNYIKFSKFYSFITHILILKNLL